MNYSLLQTKSYTAESCFPCGARYLLSVTPSRESKIMPFYDFKCEECGKLVEDEFFKIADDKHIKCCGIQMKQVILKPPGRIKPGERLIQTASGYHMKDEKSGSLRKVGEPPTTTT